jgi:TPR repeat protein
MNYKKNIFLFLILAFSFSYSFAQAPNFDKTLASAAQGNPSAQNNLGIMYEYGRGIQKDNTKAFEWYFKAAKNGNATAQFNIGQSYLNGSNGLSKNRVEALNWLRKSASNGVVQAKLILTELQ